VNKSCVADGIDKVAIAVGPQIGTTKALDKPWRYGLKGSRRPSKSFSPKAKPAA
jgi:DNA-3-methyladenine glycosylase